MIALNTPSKQKYARAFRSPAFPARDCSLLIACQSFGGSGSSDIGATEESSTFGSSSKFDKVKRNHDVDAPTIIPGVHVVTPNYGNEASSKTIHGPEEEQAQTSFFDTLQDGKENGKKVQETATVQAQSPESRFHNMHRDITTSQTKSMPVDGNLSRPYERDSTTGPGKPISGMWEVGNDRDKRSENSSLSSNSLVESVSIATKEPIYQVLEVNSCGSVVSKSISRRQILKSSGLRLRDVRSVDPSLWVTNSMPALLVRDQAILLNLGSLRAIVTPESVLIFDYKSIGGEAFLELLLSRLNSDTSPYVPTMPFELEVVEAALLSRTQRLERRLMEIEPRVLSLLEILPNRLTANALEELRLSKQALVELGSKAGALRQMLLELLESPQEIRRMAIMGRGCVINKEDNSIECTAFVDKQSADDEEEEMEMLLENYLQRCESCHGQAERLLDSAKEMEDSIAVNLSSRRLEVSRLELLLQVGTFCAALGALIAGIFGMNLKSYLEESVMAFWLTTGGIILGGIILFFIMYNYLKGRKIL